SLTPILAGFLLTLAARAGVEIDGEIATLAVGAGLMLAYYLLFRLQEAVADRIGWEPLRMAAGVFLGWARPPKYVEDTIGTVLLRFKDDEEHLTSQLQQLPVAAERPAAPGRAAPDDRT
ncbi:hypothetical protein, partial [Streptomyces sp. DH37]|uniref:hypothetical protein n=1 Tax=Streptomyces sp. DH37 TaxID=3040122 RepID=UPI0024435F2C